MVNILQNYINKKSNRNILIAILALVLVYIILRITIFPNDPLLPLLDSIYKAYLIIPEWISNQIFITIEAPVIIIDHEIIFRDQVAFQNEYDWFISDWSRYLLYRKWCILTLGLIWITSLPLRKKILASFCFFLVHIVAVVAGLYLIGVAFPNLSQDQISINLLPTIAGNVILLSYMAIWTLMNTEELRSGISKLGIQYQPSNKRIREFISFLFLFFVLREFLIPYFRFTPYINFLLGITGQISSLLGYPGYIEERLLVGEYGTMSLAKPCLGLMAFYLFSSFVFLTRENIKPRVTIIYIIAGLGFLSILNIIRLVTVYIVVQGVNGTERASTHHDIFNVGIYIAIFALWVLWYERFVRRAKKSVST